MNCEKGVERNGIYVQTGNWMEETGIRMISEALKYNSTIRRLNLWGKERRDEK